jgi:hypothetical protein
VERSGRGGAGGTLKKGSSGGEEMRPEMVRVRGLRGGGKGKGEGTNGVDLVGGSWTKSPGISEWNERHRTYSATKR